MTSTTSADPADGRRTLVRVTAQHPRTVVAKGSASVDAALAAALVAADHNPSTLEIVCLDARLNVAAKREGFTVIDS